MNVTGGMKVRGGRMEVGEDNDGLLTGRWGKRREKNWQRKPKWQHKSGGRKNGRGVGREKVRKRKCLTMRLSHWFKKVKQQGKLEKGLDFCSLATRTHPDSAH